MIPYQKKISLYALWYGLITFIGMQIYQIGLDSNTQGARCSTDSWEYGDIYQWIWDDAPCQFTTDFLIGYLFYILLYFLFNYIRTKLLQTNPSILWRSFEIGGWCAINWAYLLWLTRTEYGSLDLVMIRTSLLGILLFFLPIFCVAVGVKFLKIFL